VKQTTLKLRAILGKKYTNLALKFFTPTRREFSFRTSLNGIVNFDVILFRLRSGVGENRSVLSKNARELFRSTRGTFHCLFLSFIIIRHRQLPRFTCFVELPSCSIIIPMCCSPLDLANFYALMVRSPIDSITKVRDSIMELNTTFCILISQKAFLTRLIELTAKKKKVEHCYHLITKGLRMVSLR
jgi:hypothetical protein